MTTERTNLTCPTKKNKTAFILLKFALSLRFGLLSKYSNFYLIGLFALISVAAFQTSTSST